MPTKTQPSRATLLDALPPASAAGSRAWGVVLFAGAAVATVAVRLRLLAMPFERDEGEYAYMGQLMLQGVPPYRLAYNMKLPGTYAAYAAIMRVFGESVTGVHLGLLVVNLATALLVYRVARFAFRPFGAGVAAATFLVLSVVPAVYGLAAHATHFATLFAMAGLLLLLQARANDQRVRFCLSGVCFGLAILMKQPAVCFAVFGALYLVLAGVSQPPVDRRRLAVQLALYGTGVILPIAVTLVALAAAGVFATFGFWTFAYARAYASLVSFGAGLHALRDSFVGLVAGAPWLWGVAALGFVLSIAHRDVRRHALLLYGFAAFSLLAVCPGFYFRPHYWIVLLPAAGLMAGAAVTVAADGGLRLRRARRLAAAVPTLVVGLAIGQALVANRAILLQLSPVAACRAIYGTNPFPESVVIADFIRRNSAQDATVAILGSEPQIPFYAGRRSASGHVYTYALMEPQPFALQMQHEMARQIEARRPEFVVQVNVRTSWLWRANSPTYIFDWFEDYRRRRLDPVGLIELVPGGEARYRWGAAAAAPPESPDYLIVYKDHG